MRDYLFNTEKIKYIKDDKKSDKPVDCILCAIRDRSPRIRSLEVYRTDNFLISVNLYPFNPGHLMIFPLRHVENINDLTDEEALEMHHLISKTVTILEEEFNPSGFNIGYNLGKESGASMAHIHKHIVPRYRNEIGFLDVLSNTRVMVIDPVDIMERLRRRY